VLDPIGPLVFNSKEVAGHSTPFISLPHFLKD
jgi:hypothetical protein